MENNKVFSVNFAVDCIYCAYDKVMVLFSNKEDALAYLQKEAEDRFNTLRERGYIMFKTHEKMSLENPESGEYEKFYLQEWEVK